MTTILPEHILKLVSPEDRAKLGPAGVTKEEAENKWQFKNERTLQTQLVNLLRQKGIEPLWHRTDRRSRATIGWPDITFAVRGFGCLWEVKYGDGKLSQEQATMLHRLSTPPNSWVVNVVRSVDEGLAFLKELEL